MRFTDRLFMAVVLLGIGGVAFAQDQDKEKAEPFLRVKPGGPQSYVTAVAFSPSGNTLYAAGWDKVVHVWERDRGTQQFVPRSDSTLRIPVGPGLRGAINAMALSLDGRWLAVAGHGIMRGGGTFRRSGRVVPSEGVLTPEMRLDEGVIYVFDTRNRSVKTLRGHYGAVLALAFAPGSPETPTLVSAAREWSVNETPGRFLGAVRVWDVLGKERPNAYLAGRYLPEPTTRPGLAARRTGRALNQIQLGIAWGDEQFRVWDVDTNQLQQTPCGRYGNCVAAVDLGYLTSAYSRGGRIEFRKPLEVQDSELLGGGGGEFFIPRALSSSASDDEVSLAVVSRIVDQSREEANRFTLQLASTQPDGLQPLSGRSRLWRVPTTGALPAVAVSRAARQVAVAGDSDQSVWIFGIPELRRGGRPTQVLRNVGGSWREVAFVERDNRRGLMLARGPEGIVFDLEGDVGVTEPASWEPETGGVSGWQLESGGQLRAGAAMVVKDGQPQSQIRLPTGETLSTAAFGIVGAAGDESVVVAVASHNRGQSTLRLYDAESGAPFRQLTAHTQTIHQIAFSSNRKLMATVADDQMVCIWDVSDVDSVLDAHGMLTGIAVRQNGDTAGVTVTSVQPNAAESLRTTLSAGDVVQAFVVGDEDRSWKSGREFFDVFWSLKPGTRGTLRFQSGGRARQVAAQIGQAVDERKPLMSFFIAAPNDQQEREWIAWTPIGPYEASSRDAERLLGWHFNTGDSSTPVRFAAATEYREAYYHESLVKQLIEHGELQKQAPPPPAAVSVRFGSDAVYARSPEFTHLIRNSPRKLLVFLSDFPADRVRTVEVELAGQRFENSTRLAEDAWSIDLDGVDWDRGSRQVRTTIHTSESPPRRFTRETVAHRIPLPPTIDSSVAERQVVETPRFSFTASVNSNLAEGARVRLVQNGKAVDLVAGRIEHELDLQPGDNQIELVATNANADAGSADWETERKSFLVTYHKAKALPPKIVLTQFSTRDSASGEATPVSQPSGDELIRVNHPTVTVFGRVSSSAPLTLLAYARDGLDERVEITPEAGNDDWEFRQTVALTPGKQQIRIFARAADSDEATEGVSVEFVPGLPEVTLRADQSGIIQRDAGAPPVAVNLTGTLVGIDERYAFEAEIRLNDVTIGSPTINSDGTWSANIPLRGGENRLQVALRNRWGSRTTSETVQLEYLRTPIIAKAEHSAVEREPFTDITAEIECPLDRPLTGVSVNGQQLGAANWKQIGERGDVALWQATAAQIALRPGENTIRIEATNDDGPCREPVTRRLTYDAEFWAPPAITLRNAEPAMSVSQSTFDLEFRADSKSSIREYRVAVDGKPIIASQLMIQATDGNDSLVTATLELRPGVNDVAIHVKNEGGERLERCEISYVLPPVRVEVTSLESVADPQNAIRPAIDEDNRMKFAEPASSGFARLRGVVQWQGKLPSNAAAPELRVWVNDFQQRPVRLDPSKLEQQFEAVLVLGKKTENRIQLDLHGAPNDAESRLTFLVDCAEPRSGQRLHLLTIGIDEQNASSLQQRALTAVQAAVKDDGQFVQPLRSAVFDRIHTHPVLSGRVTFSDVFRLLLDVRSDLLVPTLDPSGKPMPINDVVMLYYEGGVLVPEKDHFILSTSQKYNPSRRFSAISSGWLAQFFESMRGAQLAFIDVAAQKSPANVPVGDWRHDSHAALLCYAWSDGSVPPAELRLISQLRQALVAAGRLDEVDEILRDVSTQSSDLSYHRSLPDRLKTLMLK